MDNIVNVLTFYVMLSAMTERVVEMLKGLPWLGTKIAANSKLIYVFTAIIGGLIGAGLNSSHLSNLTTDVYMVAVINGLLVSSGSGMWHDLLNIVKTNKTTTTTATTTIVTK